MMNTAISFVVLLAYIPAEDFGFRHLRGGGLRPRDQRPGRAVPAGGRPFD